MISEDVTEKKTEIKGQFVYLGLKSKHSREGDDIDNVLSNLTIDDFLRGMYLNSTQHK